MLHTAERADQGAPNHGRIALQRARDPWNTSVRQTRERRDGPLSACRLRNDLDQRINRGIGLRTASGDPRERVDRRLADRVVLVRAGGPRQEADALVGVARGKPLDGRQPACRIWRSKPRPKRAGRTFIRRGPKAPQRGASQLELIGLGIRQQGIDCRGTVDRPDRLERGNADVHG